MTMDEKIARINELYHLSQQRALTEDELKEQKELRQAYIDSVKGNLKAQLDSIKVKEPDGTLRELRKKS